jgi:AhpD family alkylhydroperoxidase
MPTTEITGTRLDWQTYHSIVPELATSMAAITHALKKSGLEPALIELVKIRTSQINGCAFCVQYHLNDARKLGIAPEKLDLLAAWREAGIFTARESAALAWTERVTLLSESHITDEEFTALQTHFSEREIAFLTTAVGQINFWNRIAAPFRFAPPIPASTV